MASSIESGGSKEPGAGLQNLLWRQRLLLDIGEEAPLDLSQVLA